MKWCRHSYCMSPSRQWVANAMEGAQVRVREGQFMLGPLFSAGPKKSAKLRWWKAVSPQYCRSQSLYVFCSYLQTCFLYLEKNLSVFNLNMRNSQYYLTRFYIEVTFINQISTQLAYFFFFFLATECFQIHYEWTLPPLSCILLQDSKNSSSTVPVFFLLRSPIATALI